jgi:phosphate transport system protein
MGTHTSKAYEGELSLLRDKIATMGTRVENMLRDSMGAMRARDGEQAKRTILDDRQVNRLELEADELSLRILAMRQPVASDLRFITMALKIVTDLERIGDLVVNLCERVIELSAEPAMPTLDDLEQLANEALAAVRESLDAWVRRDAVSARKMLQRDEGIDERYSAVFHDVLAMMARDPATIYRATRVQSIAKYLERIGDHAMNIAETVVFLVEGRDIRHRWGDGNDVPASVKVR